MSESIETFVAKLRREGVDAGQADAERLRADARAEAERIVAAARAQAEQLIADARHRANAELARGKTELELAVRDAGFRLRDGATRAITAVLARAATASLGDPAWLGATLGELVRRWGESEKGGEALQVQVSPRTKEQLVSWALRAGGAVELEGTLKSAGFTYRARGAAVEVTPESVAETLAELVSPELHTVVERALRSAP